MAKKNESADPFEYFDNFFTSDPNMIALFNVLVKELASSLEAKGREEAIGQAQTPASLQAAEREPLVEIIEKEEEMVVIAELPGIEKKDIMVDCTQLVMNITASNQEMSRNYFREIGLPVQIAKRGIRARYNNGVLEITARKGKASSKRYSIKIE